MITRYRHTPVLSAPEAAYVCDTRHDTKLSAVRTIDTRMSDSAYEVMESPPNRSNAPSTCQHNACDQRTTYYVSYRSPDEYVCYCESHARNAWQSYKLARNISRIR